MHTTLVVVVNASWASRCAVVVEGNQVPVHLPVTSCGRPRWDSEVELSLAAVSELSILKCANMSNVDSFEHLVGESYLNDDTLLKIISTRDVEHKGLTIAC